MSMRDKESALLVTIKTGSWDEKVNAADRIAQKDPAIVVQPLIELLSSDDCHVRNASALALRELKDQNAAVALMNAIAKSKTGESPSTLIYALQCHDCKDFFREVFGFALSKSWSWEAREMANHILDEQRFSISDEDLEWAERELDSAKDDHLDGKYLTGYLQELRDEE
ncbi:MAG: HEAT repeat protein [Planctomycetota bacterium]|jgi:HEAT repeat protein